jgi:hypothetical protein
MIVLAAGIIRILVHVGDGGRYAVGAERRPAT